MSVGIEPSQSGPVVRGYFIPVVDEAGARPVTFVELGRAVRARVLMIAMVTFACVAIGGLAAVVLPKRYVATVVLTPVAETPASGALGGLLSQFGGVAALAGLSMGGDNLKTEAYATLNSRAFVDEFIRDENLMPLLFESRWDAQRKEWLPSWWRPAPTPGDAYERFSNKVRSVDQDRRTGIVSVSISWSDPVLAARWANEMVSRLNARLRDRAIRESRRNIELLQTELGRTDIVAARDTVGRVLESEVRRLMLATARTDFAFRVIDPAVVAAPHEFASPRRALLVAAAAAAGLLLGLMLAIGSHLVGRDRPGAD